MQPPGALTPQRGLNGSPREKKVRRHAADKSSVRRHAAVEPMPHLIKASRRTHRERLRQLVTHHDSHTTHVSRGDWSTTANVTPGPAAGRHVALARMPR
eukprot:scaffold79770_cov70-Phaeocystis_antarctica.AAC.2